VFFGHGRDIDIFGHERVINILGHGRAINILGHGRAINIFGHERAINIFGSWKAIIILWNNFTWGQLGLWEISKQPGSNLFKLIQTCSKWINLFKLDQIVSKWLNVVQNRSDGFKTDQIFTLKCLLAMGGP
jgi:hypothetical protein